MLILDELLDELREARATFFHKRKGGGGIDSMADIGLAAFSLFFMRVESFVSHQRSREEGQKTSNCLTLFGRAKIPTDNHIRAMLDPVHPSQLKEDGAGRRSLYEPWADTTSQAGRMELTVFPA